ncbi:MAG: prepilin peptidase [Lachnospiraceae bacterium]|nr:prepilin peptidase [Lachnospiraceae bacterium]
MNGSDLREIIPVAVLLVFIAVSDVRKKKIPDSLIVCGILIRILFGLSGGAPELINAFASGLFVTVPLMITALILEAVREKKILGGGDVKLVFLLSLFFPWQISAAAVLMAFAIGSAAICVDRAVNRKPRLYPMGIAVAAGFLMAFLFQNSIINWWSGYGTIM